MLPSHEFLFISHGLILYHLLTCLLTYLVTYLLTYLLTPLSRALLEKLTGSQLVTKFPAIYGTRRFITAVTSARQLSLFWTRSTQSMPPHPNSGRSILILSSHLRLGLPSDLFSLGFPTKILYTTLPPYALHATHTSIFSTWSPEQYLVSSSDPLAPHYVFQCFTCIFQFNNR